MTSSPVSVGDDGQPGLTAQDFDRVRSMIYERAGIALVESKRMMVHSRLNRRLSATGIGSFSAYLDHVERSPDEQQNFINALTTNLTSFYREAYHFPILEQHLKSMQGTAEVRIWCGASSTGEEPYSIAMTALDALGSRRGFRLLATDIDTVVLETARRGVYPADAIESVPEAQRRSYLMRGQGANAGKVRIKPEVVSHVQFRQFNLIQPSWTFDAPFDAIFLRNVLIYFDGPTRDGIMRRLHGVIRPGGLLFIGHSETLGDTGGMFKLEGRTVYRALAASGASPQGEAGGPSPKGATAERVHR